jgi:hypothetical protein
MKRRWPSRTTRPSACRPASPPRRSNTRQHFKRHSQAGMVMVNLPTAGVDYHVPFGGRKGSSFGSREQGKYAQEFFTTVKTARSLGSGRLRRIPLAAVGQRRNVCHCEVTGRALKGRTTGNRDTCGGLLCSTPAHGMRMRPIHHLKGLPKPLLALTAVYFPHQPRPLQPQRRVHLRIPKSANLADSRADLRCVGRHHLRGHHRSAIDVQEIHDPGPAAGGRVRGAGL